MLSLSCSMLDLTPWPGIEPGPLRWQRGVLATRDLKFSLLFFFFLTFWLHHEACSILAAQPGTESTLHAVEAPEGNPGVLKTIYWSMIGPPWLKESACNAGGPRFDPWVGNIPWRREWLQTPVFLPGKSCGQRSLAVYSLWGLGESDRTESARAHKHTHTEPLCI